MARGNIYLTIKEKKILRQMINIQLARLNDLDKDMNCKKTIKEWKKIKNKLV